MCNCEAKTNNYTLMLHSSRTPYNGVYPVCIVDLLDAAGDPVTNATINAQYGPEITRQRVLGQYFIESGMSDSLFMPQTQKIPHDPLINSQWWVLLIKAEN